MCLQAIAFNELQETRHEELLQNSIILARKLAGEFSEVSLTELAIEVSVCANIQHHGCTLAYKPDDQPIAANGAAHRRLRPRPDESVVFVLHAENGRECQT